jgi:hypothetical protein
MPRQPGWAIVSGRIEMGQYHAGARPEFGARPLEFVARRPVVGELWRRTALDGEKSYYKNMKIDR